MSSRPRATSLTSSRAGLRRPSFFVLVAAIPLILYARTATFDFVRADDADLIAGNQGFLRDLRNIPRAFTRSYFEVEGELTNQKTYYRPIAIVSFMVDAARGGANPRHYHLTNVVLHAAASCLLLALALKWGAPPWAAIGAAILFAVHPVNVQAVAWIAGRNDLLLAAFGLLSLVAWSGTPAGTVVHVIAYAVALFAKETGIFIPALAVLHHTAVRRDRIAKLQWIGLGFDAAVSVVWLVLRGTALSGMSSELSADALRAGASNALQLLVHAGKMVAPVRLNVSPSADAGSILLGAAAAIALAWIGWRWMPRPLALFAGCWWLAFLVPTLLVPGMPAYEHRAYVPLIGLLVCAGASASDTRLNHRARIVAAACFAAVVVAFAGSALRRIEVFRNPITYWTDGTRDPKFGPIAHVNLGQLYEAEGRPHEARREYLRALERDPGTPKAHNNLGVVLMALGDAELALAHFKEEARRHPWNADAWFNLGLWHELRGQQEEARSFYERAIAENPAYEPAYEKLGRAAPRRSTAAAARVP